MTEEKKQSIALMRYAIIAPVITHAIPKTMTMKEFLDMASKKEYTDNNGESHYFSPGTIERWLYSYKKKGFNGLLPNTRSDIGQSRKIDDELLETIRYYKSNHPRMPATEIHKALCADGVITNNELSLSTITRCVNAIKKENNIATTNEMRRYERPHINEVWCGDSCVGPKLNINGSKQRVYIIALIDDASRFITGAVATLKDNYTSLLSIIKSATLKYGIPSMFNFDNGKNYRSKQMELLAARIGSSIYFCRPYSPTQKSKIERWFRTLRDKWLATIDLSNMKTLEEIQRSLDAFVLTYNQTVHSSLNGKTPEERFFSESERIKRIPIENVDTLFLLEIERKVSIDCVVSIDNVEYEVDTQYSNKRIKLRYSPDMKQIYVVEANDILTPIKLLSKVDNAFIKRNKVYYSKGVEC